MNIGTIYENLLSWLREIFFPSVCRCCGRKLNDDEHFLCGDCLMNLPVTMQSDYPKEMNFVRKKFTGYNIENCCCYFIYDKRSGYGNIVKEIKFGNDKKLGTFMGSLFGNILADGEQFTDMDLIVPVPLHEKRKRERGYNQSEIIAEAIAEKLGISMCCTAVERVKHTEPQSRLTSSPDRKDNMRGAFAVINASALNGKHILLVDDVITTGETMKSLVSCINKNCTDVRISIAALSAVK